MALGTCAIEACEKPVRSARATLCAMHYHRQYRHGSIERSARVTGVSASHGRHYQMTYLPQHPLAAKNGKTYEHRRVLFDQIGPGAHPCHWCTSPVRWEAPRFAVDELQVDHINGRTDDNRIENLVPSCRRCNVTRATQARSAALRTAGWWSKHDTIAALTDHRRAERIA